MHALPTLIVEQYRETTAVYVVNVARPEKMDLIYAKYHIAKYI